jgi:hypothetical protein
MPFDPGVYYDEIPWDEIPWEELMGVWIAVVGVFLVILILNIIAKWRIYTKAKKPGWAALIPFYTDYIYYELSWGEGWNFLYSYVSLPFIPFVIGIITCIKVARSFGKGDGFAVGLIFLPTIFSLILAFGKSEYCGPVRKLSESYE